MTFEVSSCTKFQIFQGFAPDPTGGATVLPLGELTVLPLGELTVLPLGEHCTVHVAGGEGGSPQEPHLHSLGLGLQPFLGLMSVGDRTKSLIDSNRQ